LSSPRSSYRQIDREPRTSPPSLGGITDELDARLAAVAPACTPLDKNLFLITSATDQPPTSRRSPLGKRRHPETLARTPALACVHASAKKKAAAPSDLNPTVAYRFACQAPGGPPDLGRPSLDPPRSV
jgi:hypothetical protein